MEGREEILQEGEGRLVLEVVDENSLLLLVLSGDQQVVVQMLALLGRERLVLEVAVHWHWRREEGGLEVVVDQRGI